LSLGACEGAGCGKGSDEPGTCIATGGGIEVDPNAGIDGSTEVLAGGGRPTMDANLAFLLCSLSIVIRRVRRDEVAGDGLRTTGGFEKDVGCEDAGDGSEALGCGGGGGGRRWLLSRVIDVRRRFASGDSER